MIFSSMTVFLFILIFSTGSAPALKINSLFGITLAGGNYIPFWVIMISLLAIILYELVMFKMHFEVSQKSFIDKFDKKNNDWVYALGCSTMHFDSDSLISIAKELDFAAKEISSSLSCINRKNAKLIDFKHHLTMEHYKYKKMLHNSISEQKEIIQTLKKLLQKYNLHFAEIDDAIEKLDRKTDSQLNLGEISDTGISNSFKLNEAVFHDYMSDIASAKEMVKNFNSEIITSHHIELIKNDISDRNKYAENLLSDISEIAYDVKKLKVYEFYIPLSIGLLSVFLSVFYLVSHYHYIATKP